MYRSTSLGETVACWHCDNGLCKNGLSQMPTDHHSSNINHYSSIIQHSPFLSGAQVQFCNSTGKPRRNRGMRGCYTWIRFLILFLDRYIILGTAHGHAKVFPIAHQCLPQGRLVSRFPTLYMTMQTGIQTAD